jgi:hypothetical protein
MEIKILLKETKEWELPTKNKQATESKNIFLIYFLSVS